MQAGQATQALGVQLYFYVRCPTCNKVLGNLQEDYAQLIKNADEEVRDMIPLGLDYADLMNEYDTQMANKFGDIMKKLGIKRYCCMMRIKNPQQVPISGGPAPEANIAISRHTPGVKRNPTIIHLTKRSKVPSGSNIEMMSLTGADEEYNLKRKADFLEGVGIESWEEKARLEIGSFNPSDVVSTGRSMSSEVSLPILNKPVLSTATFSGLIATVETGVSIPLKKRPKIANAKTKVPVNTITHNDMMELENSRMLTFDTVPPILGSQRDHNNYIDRMNIDDSDLMDIQSLTLSST